MIRLTRHGSLEVFDSEPAGRLQRRRMRSPQVVEVAPPGSIARAFGFGPLLDLVSVDPSPPRRRLTPSYQNVMCLTISRMLWTSRIGRASATSAGTSARIARSGSPCQASPS